MKKVEGISEVRDESDREGLRVVIELKKNANAQGILNYLFKNTDLQVSYNFNMVAINNKRPEHVGLKKILEAYLEHQREVTTRRTKFDLEKAKAREHIVKGLIKALSILDDVIKTIRASKNKSDAKKNLVSEFSFTEAQAEAIVSLQLYRLTNTDVTALQKEAEELQKAIANFENILANPKELDKVIRRELNAINKKYGSERLTIIQDEISSLKIETEVMVAQEDVMLLVSHDGYVKRSSLRSFNASDNDENGLKDEDYPILQSIVNTLSHLFIFTNKGNLIYRPIHEVIESRWKDTGEHLSQTVGLGNDEYVLNAFVFEKIDQDAKFLIATKEGYIKQVKLADLKPGRTYKTRASRYIKLKTNVDEVISVSQVESDKSQVFCASYTGYGLRYSLDEVPTNGALAAGVKCMDLRDDTLANVILVSESDEVSIITQRGSYKKMKVADVPLTTRARRGVQILRELKTKPHRIIFAELVQINQELVLLLSDGKQETVKPEDHQLNDRYSNGSFVTDAETDTIENIYTKIIED